VKGREENKTYKSSLPVEFLKGTKIIETTEVTPQKWITKQANGSITYNSLNFWFARHNQV
jgi:hypothetical protein